MRLLAYNTRTTTERQYIQDATLLFGDDIMKWRFVCPACGHIASFKDYQNAEVPLDSIAFSCIGRWLPVRQSVFMPNGGPCDYAGGSLFALNPVHIDGHGDFFELDGYETLTHEDK